MSDIDAPLENEAIIYPQLLIRAKVSLFTDLLAIKSYAAT